MKKYIISLLIAFAASIGVVLGSNRTYAIETTLTVSPVEQKMTLYPGETSTGSIRISNPISAEEKLYYKITVAPFTRGGDNYGPLVGSQLSGGAYNDIVDWVTFSSDSGSVEPNGTDEVIFTVNVPEDARGGGQYFAILVARTEGPDTEKSDGGVRLKEVIQIASTVYASISGSDIQLSGAIKDNNISSVFLNPPVESSFTVENTGNTHMEINYYMQVFPVFSDEEVYTTEENPSYAIVLPGTTRYVSQKWEGTPLFGIFRVRQVASYSGSDDKSITEKTVIVCPIWLLFAIILAVFLIIGWIVVKVRGRKKSYKKIG